MKSVTGWLALCIFAATGSVCNAQSESAAASLESIVGNYQGKLTFSQGGRMMVDYDYSIEIVKVNVETGKVSIKSASDFYPSREIKLNNCELGENKSKVTFICKGKNGWHEDFELNGNSLKGSGVTKKNFPYFISTTKVNK